MELNQAVEELYGNLEEIRKQNRLLKIRRILRFFLIGFLIGRNSKEKISELIKLNEQIIDTLLKHFLNVNEVGKRIKSFSEGYSRLTAFENKINLYEKELTAITEPLLQNLKNKSINAHQEGFAGALDTKL